MKIYLFVPESVPLLLCKISKLFATIVAYFRLKMVGKFTFLSLCKEKTERAHKNKLLLM